MVSPFASVVIANLDMFSLTNEEWSSPEMKTLGRMLLLSIVTGILGMWAGARLIAGAEGSLLRVVIWNIAVYPLFLLGMILGVLIMLLTPVGGSIATVLFLVILPIWAAGAIFKVGFWRGLLILIISGLIGTGLYYSTLALAGTPEELAAIEKFGNQYSRRVKSQVENRSGKPQPSSIVVKGAEADWQRAAVEKYPALGMAGSPLNTMFVARVKLCRSTRPEVFQSPDWPMKLADEVARELGSQPK